MAWTATEDFESYSADTDIDGASGGTNWSGNWAKSAGLFAVRTAPAGGLTGKVAANDASAAAGYSRAFSSITAGSVRIRMQSSDAGVDGGPLFLAESGGGRMYVKFDADEIKAFNHGVGYVTVASVADNTAYDVDIEFDSSGQPNQYRVRVDEGTWTSWLTVNGGSYTNVNSLNVDFNGPRTFVDGIEPTPAGGGGSVSALIGGKLVGSGILLKGLVR